MQLILPVSDKIY